MDKLGKSMKTVKGPGIFLAQFVDSKAPFNSLDGMCKWAADTLVLLMVMILMK